MRHTRASELRSLSVASSA